MNDLLRPFNGEFIKHKHYIAYKDVLRNGYVVNFDEQLYAKVGGEIESLLGKKSKYSVREAVLYFQTKYQAYRVPWEYAAWYEDASYDIIYDPMSERDPDSMNPFDYSKTSKEKNITLVIDTVFNKALREKYPDIEEFEQERLMRGEGWTEGEIPHCNGIIVIGYIKENKINSMFRGNNYTNIIPEIDYEMWYFYNHC